jgi:hypothetical protein
VSYALARARLVSIVEGTTPSNTSLLQDAFKELPEGATQDSVTSRRFFLENAVDGDMGIPGPFTPDLAGQPRISTAITLVVVYRDQPTRRTTLDVQMTDDWKDIAVRLLDPANWNGSSSGILSVTNSPLFLGTRRTFPRAGVVEQRTTFSLLFR